MVVAYEGRVVIAVDELIRFDSLGRSKIIVAEEDRGKTTSGMPLL